MMFGGTCIESISAEGILPLQERKSRGGDDNMDEAFFATDRAITSGRFEVGDLDLVANFLAVTATCKSCEVIHE